MHHSWNLSAFQYVLGFPIHYSHGVLIVSEKLYFQSRVWWRYVLVEWHEHVAFKYNSASFASEVLQLIGTAEVSRQI